MEVLYEKFGCGHTLLQGQSCGSDALSFVLGLYLQSGRNLGCQLQQEGAISSYSVCIPERTNCRSRNQLAPFDGVNGGKEQNTRTLLFPKVG